MSDQSRKKEVTLSIIAIVLLIVAVLGITYAVFNFSQAGTKENTISTGTLTFTYTSDTNGISIVNAEPIYDAVGKVIPAQKTAAGIQQGYFDFTVACTMTGTAIVNYEVSATYDDTVSNLLDPSYVKVYLTDGGATEVALSGYDGSTVPTYSSLPESEVDTSAKKLYEGSFSNSSSKKFRLRMWVSSDYTENDASNTFKLKVNVNASS